MQATLHLNWDTNGYGCLLSERFNRGSKKEPPNGLTEGPFLVCGRVDNQKVNRAPTRIAYNDCVILTTDVLGVVNAE